MSKKEQNKLQQEQKVLKKDKTLVVLGVISLIVGAIFAVFGLIFFIINIFSSIGSFILYGVICVVGFLLLTFGCIFAKPVIARFGFNDNKYAKSYAKEDIQALEEIGKTDSNENESLKDDGKEE